MAENLIWDAQRERHSNQREQLTYPHTPHQGTFILIIFKNEVKISRIIPFAIRYLVKSEATL